MQSEQCRTVFQYYVDVAFLERAAGGAALTRVHTSAAALQEHFASLPSTVSPRSGPRFVQGLRKKTRGKNVRKYEIMSPFLFIWQQQSRSPRIFANTGCLLPQKTKSKIINTELNK